MRAELSKIPELHRLLEQADGDPCVCVAVLDRPWTSAARRLLDRAAKVVSMPQD